MDRTVSNHQTEFDEPLVKVFIRLEPADWHDYKTESVWAEPLGNGLYRIRNVPFHAMGVSHQDIVRASLVDGTLFFDRAERRGGHSTYRFIAMDGITEDQWAPYWQPLQEIGCTYERGGARLFAADVPPETDIYKAYELLDAGEKAGCGVSKKPTAAIRCVNSPVPGGEPQQNQRSREKAPPSNQAAALRWPPKPTRQINQLPRWHPRS